MTLAFLALVMKVAAPPGFMFAAQGNGAHSAPAFALVICTGHGPLDLAKDKDGQTKQRADAPCAFAGHAAPPTPALGASTPRPRLAEYKAPLAVFADLMPGRGLAAPPPPSQGPPLTL